VCQWQRSTNKPFADATTNATTAKNTPMSFVLWQKMCSRRGVNSPSIVLTLRIRSVGGCVRVLLRQCGTPGAAFGPARRHNVRRGGIPTKKVEKYCEHGRRIGVHQEQNLANAKEIFVLVDGCGAKK